MRGTDTRPATTIPVVSKFLLLAVVLVLFSSFFMTEHRMRYSLRNSESGSTTTDVSAINQGSVLKRFIFFSMATFFLLLFLRRSRRRIDIRGGLYWLLFGYILWALMSVFWADQFNIVARRLVMFLIFCVSGFSISLNVPFRRLVDIILWTNLLFLLVGILSELVSGTLLISFGEYRFSGTYHPASQGLNCASLLLAATITARSEKRSTRRFSYVVMILAMFFLLLTRSRGPFVGVLIAILVCKFYSAERSRTLKLLFVLIMVSCVAFLVLGDALSPMISGGILLGRQGEHVNSLTGRVPMWIECMDYVRERPMCGYGYGGFWTGDRLLDIRDSQGWSVGSSHSAYIETVLNLGLVGLTILLMMVVSVWWTARRLWMRRRDDGMVFALGLLTLWMADGILSTSITTQGFVGFLALVVFFGVARENVEWKNRRGRPELGVSSAE